MSVLDINLILKPHVKHADTALLLACSMSTQIFILTLLWFLDVQGGAEEMGQSAACTKQLQFFLTSTSSDAVSAAVQRPLAVFVLLNTHALTMCIGICEKDHLKLHIILHTLKFRD